MRKWIVMACLVAMPAYGQQPMAPVATYQVQLTDLEIETIIQMGGACLKALGYDCGAAFDIRAKLQAAKQPRPVAPPPPVAVPESK